MSTAARALCTAEVRVRLLPEAPTVDQEAHGVTEARRAPTSPDRVRLLVGLLVAGRREPVIWTPRFDSANGFALHDRDDSRCGPGRHAARSYPQRRERRDADVLSRRVRRPASRPGRTPATWHPRRRADRPEPAEFDGGAHVRVYVEDTSARRARFRRSPPAPHLRLRIADCVNEIALEFSVSSPELRENSLHKIETLLGALSRFRSGLEAEAELYAARERR